MMNRSIAFLLFFVFVLSGVCTADQGKVLKVVDGDTFLAEVAGKKGLETIEVNLRCSDAPVATSPFGPESKQFLSDLLGKSAPVHYKVQAFCGSEKCVEALAYFPVEEGEKISYLNAQMIEAGMARNNNCRGVFARAETTAKSAKAGIWSTSKKIVYTKPQKQSAQKSAPTKTVAKKTMSTVKEAPAVIRFDRAERTVTIKSAKISLSRIIDTIDTVSPSPINLYLQTEQYIPINLDNTHWYEALRYVVENADLKQVNLDGKIDLYTRLFYYKHVSPYLKIAGNVGVYMNAGSGGGSKELTKDDGTTRYVFINDFENSAEVAQQYREAKAKNESSGFIQVHDGSSSAPVSNYGTFTRSDQSHVQPQVAKTDPVKEVTPPALEPVKEPVVEKKLPTRAALKPYSGEKVIVEEEPVVVAAAPAEKPVPPAPVAKKEEPVQKQPEQEAVKAEAEKPPVEKAVAATDEESVAAKGTAAEETSESETEAEAGSTAEKAAVAKSDVSPGAAPAAQIQFSLAHAVAILLIIAVVIIGCIYLTRSAGAKAAEAEKHVEPDELEEKEELDIDTDVQVDKKYEEEIFDQLDHASDPAPAEDDSGAELEDDSEPEEEPVAEEEPAEEEPAEEEPAEEEPAEEEPAEEDYHPKDVSGKDKRVQDEGTEESAVEEKAAGYDEGVHGPERVPRKICLFEVKCSVDSNSFTGIGLDISAGGMFVDSKDVFDVGKVVELEFKLFEADEGPVRCRGAVTWYNQRPDPIKPDYPNGFGVRFIDMDATTIEKVGEYLQTDDETA